MSICKCDNKTGFLSRSICSLIVMEQLDRRLFRVSSHNGNKSEGLLDKNWNTGEK